MVRGEEGATDRLEAVRDAAGREEEEEGAEEVVHLCCCCCVQNYELDQ